MSAKQRSKLKRFFVGAAESSSTPSPPLCPMSPVPTQGSRLSHSSPSHSESSEISPEKLKESVPATIDLKSLRFDDYNHVFQKSEQSGGVQKARRAVNDVGRDANPSRAKELLSHRKATVAFPSAAVNITELALTAEFEKTNKVVDFVKGHHSAAGGGSERGDSGEGFVESLDVVMKKSDPSAAARIQCEHQVNAMVRRVSESAIRSPDSHVGAGTSRPQSAQFMGLRKQAESPVRPTTASGDGGRGDGGGDKNPKKALEIKLFRLFSEYVEWEYKHLRDLRAVQKVLVPYLSKDPGSAPGGVTWEDIKLLLLGILMVEPVKREFFYRLIPLYENWDPYRIPVLFAQAVLHMTPFFKVYTVPTVNLETIVKVAQACTMIPELKPEIARIGTHSIHNTLQALWTHLIRVQTFLTEMVKICQKLTPDDKILPKAASEVGRVIYEANEARREHEMSVKFASLEWFGSSSIPVNASRKLLLFSNIKGRNCEPWNAMSPKHLKKADTKAKVDTMFMFNDALVFARRMRGKDQYEIINIIDLENLLISDLHPMSSLSGSDERLDRAFVCTTSIPARVGARRGSSGRGSSDTLVHCSYLLLCVDVQEKNEWLRDLTDNVDKRREAIKSRQTVRLFAEDSRRQSDAMKMQSLLDETISEQQKQLRNSSALSRRSSSISSQSSIGDARHHRKTSSTSTTVSVGNRGSVGSQPPTEPINPDTWAALMRMPDISELVQSGDDPSSGDDDDDDDGNGRLAAS